MSESEHPSHFQLDLVSLQQARASVVAHVSACAQCQTSVAAYRPETVVPSWVTSAPRPTKHWGWYGLASVLAVFAAVIVALTVFNPFPKVESTRVKSLPSFALYVEHGPDVHVWDGRSPFIAGDRIQLKVAPMGFAHLVVASSSASGWSELHSSAISPTGEYVLPQSFVVDDHDQSIELAVLLCDAPCDLKALLEARQNSQRDEHRWFSQFTLIRKTP